MRKKVDKIIELIDYSRDAFSMPLVILVLSVVTRKRSYQYQNAPIIVSDVL